MQSFVHRRLSNLHEAQGEFPPIFTFLETKKKERLCLGLRGEKE